MNKKTFKKATGRIAVTYNNYRQGSLARSFSIMDKEDWERRSREDKEKRGIQYGPRERILEAYKINGQIDDTVAVMNDINNKIGKQAYTVEMVKVWIQEYENKNKSRDDDDDAR